MDWCDCVHSGWHLQGQNGVTKIRTGLSCKRAQGDLYNFLCKRIQKRHRYDRPTGCKGTGLHARPELKNLPPGTYTIEAWHEAARKGQNQDRTSKRENAKRDSKNAYKHESLVRFKQTAKTRRTDDRRNREPEQIEGAKRFRLERFGNLERMAHQPW